MEGLVPSSRNNDASTPIAQNWFTMRPKDLKEGNHPLLLGSWFPPIPALPLTSYFLSPYCTQTCIFTLRFELFTDIPAGPHHHNHLVTHIKRATKLVESL